MQTDLHFCFIDYSKAFDKVKYVELFTDNGKSTVWVSQRWNFSAGCGCRARSWSDVADSVLRCLLARLSPYCSSFCCSTGLMADLVVACQLMRSADSALGPAGAMAPAFRFRLHTSLYRSVGLLVGLEQVATSPYRMYLAVCRHTCG
ncbi:hypothetical protein PoB_006840100 [Plakobranchus ocellatus]|uniref:Reverse transcriptase domain-containing protein n=1 Tax=Plakobranchus ocellatus TaxID=259542 RepID=A0AAV4DDF1_9GAST|nr:hypothetical protein PoB_006840100 [Plakobranchus ocellatus]